MRSDSYTSLYYHNATVYHSEQSETSKTDVV